MRYEEKYCIWSWSSLGGSPLEEASEQERIPSIIGSIVWCCPTSRVWYNKVVFLFYIVLWIYCVFSICGDYICGSILVLNKWYQSTFLGRSCGQIFFIFADFFFRSRKKRAATFSKFLVHFCAKFVEKGFRSEFLS